MPVKTPKQRNILGGETINVEEKWMSIQVFNAPSSTGNITITFDNFPTETVDIIPGVSDTMQCDQYGGAACTITVAASTTGYYRIWR